MRRQILLLSVGLNTLVVLAFAIPLAFLVRLSVEQRALKSATDEASSVAIFLRTGSPTDATITSYLASLATKSARRTCVQKADSTVLGQPPPGGLDRSDAASPDGGPGGGPPGGKDTDAPTVKRSTGGQIALVDAGTARDAYVVRTFVPDNSFEGSVHRWWLLLGASSLLLLLLSIVAAEVVGGRLVRPLLRTADTAHRISSGEITARAPGEGPAEVAEVGAALNRLADRIGELIAEDRETMADLSHRLRTPLTALRLDIDGLDDRAAGERLGEQVSALERTLTAIIRTARRPRSAALVPACNATDVVAERVAFWSPLAEDQGRRMDIGLPAHPIAVRCEAEELSAAVDALLENVIAHTPEGSALAVRLTAAESGAVLAVSDGGPGIPAASSIRGRSDRGSSGLGLSIARRCAETSGGDMTIQVGPNGTGSTVILRLGSA